VQMVALSYYIVFSHVDLIGDPGRRDIFGA